MMVEQNTTRTWLPELLSSISTPALVYDEVGLEATLGNWLACRETAGFKLLYAVKASAFLDVLLQLSRKLDGFAASSLFEARLVKDLFPSTQVHLTTPGILPSEVGELGELCEFISLNSVSQLKRFGNSLNERASLGIRINTRVSSVADQRYDPCRPKSKLGVPIEQLTEILGSSPRKIEGLHFHTNADSSDFNELAANIELLIESVPQDFQLRWVNLGGGYLLEQPSEPSLTKSVKFLQRRLGAEVFLEPGAGLVRAAGYLVCTIVDMFDIDGSRIAILDTTVNHMPEVLEFNYTPYVMGQDDDGPYEYILAGNTCLAGDVFGTYKFAESLAIGCKVIFEEAGAYTLAKADRFNGINLPQVGVVDTDGEYRVRKTYDYLDFASYWMTDV